MHGTRPQQLIVIGPTPPPAHGGSVFMVSLLRALRARGLLAAHLDTRDPRPVSTLDRLDVTNVRLGLAHAWGLLRLLRANPGAAVYVPISQTPWGFRRDAVFIALARLYRRPIYLHLHGGGFHRFYAAAGPLTRLLVRRSVGAAEGAWVLTPSLRVCFEGLVDPERIKVVANVVEDPLAAHGAELAPRDADGGGARGLRILYLSNLYPRKGHFELLEALEAIGERARGWHVRFVGEAEPAVVRKMASQASRLPLEVEITGPRLGPAKAAELAWADVFALPTSYGKEGQPLVVLEAMAASLAIVATEHAGIPEALADGEEGLLVPPGDVGALAAALERLADDPAERQRLGRAARSRYERDFRPERLAGELDELLR